MSPNWSDPLDWIPTTVPGIPGNEDVAADFLSPSQMMNQPVILDASFTLNTIYVHDNYTFSADASGSLTLGGGSFIPTLTIDAGKTLTFDSTAQLTIDSIVSGGSTTIMGSIISDGNVQVLSSLFLPSNSSLSTNIIESTSANISIQGTMTADSFLINGGNILSNANTSNVNIYSLMRLENNAILKISNGSFFAHGFIADSSTVFVTNVGNLTIPTAGFTNSTLTIKGGHVDLGTNANFDNSTLQTGNSSFLSLSRWTFSNSIFNIDQGDLQVLDSGILDTNSTLNILSGSLTADPNSDFSVRNSIVNISNGNFAPGYTNIEDSSVNIQQGNFEPSDLITITLTDAYNEHSYFNIGAGNADFPEGIRFLTDDNNFTLGSPHTYTIFSIADGSIIHQNYDLTGLPDESNWLLITRNIEKKATVILTYLGTPPFPPGPPSPFVNPSNTLQFSPLGILASLTSIRNLTTLQHAERMGDRVRWYASEYFLAQADVPVDSYLAQNTLLAQQSPDELLSERAIERPYYPWSFYIAPTGSYGNTKKKHGHLGNDFYTVGFLTGFDWTSSYVTNPDQNYAFGIGSIFYYNHFHAKVDQHVGNASVDQIFANIYGTWISRCLEELSVNFSVGAGYDWNHFKRNIPAGFGNNIAHSDPGGYEVGSFIGIEYLFSCAQFPHMGRFRFIPIAMLEYNWLSLNDYTEHGAGIFDLKIKSDSINSLRSFLGARMNYLFRAHCAVTIRPEVTLGWQREYLDTSQRSTFYNFTAIGPSTGTLFTATPDRNTFIAGADLYVHIYEQNSILFNYQMNLSDSFFANSFYLEWKLEF